MLLTSLSPRIDIVRVEEGGGEVGWLAECRSGRTELVREASFREEVRLVWLCWSDRGTSWFDEDP